MSVLVRGMEMPTSCCNCAFHVYHSYGEYVCAATPLFYPMNLANYTDGRKDFCPLVEVPPHGRLICADALANKTFYNPVSAPYITYRTFIDAPTIIEAEWSEDENNNV